MILIVCNRDDKKWNITMNLQLQNLPWPINSPTCMLSPFLLPHHRLHLYLMPLALLVSHSQRQSCGARIISAAAAEMYSCLCVLIVMWHVCHTTRQSLHQNNNKSMLNVKYTSRVFQLKYSRFDKLDS